jgi:hypothetical protein
MSRQIIQLHTIDQWMALDPAARVVVLKSLKIKDRLQRYLLSLNTRKGEDDVLQPTWVRCSKCADSPHPGFLLKEPRYDGIHPSQIAHPCLLKTYKDIIGAASQSHIEPRVQLIFDLGHAVHHMFQTYGLNGAWGPYYKHEVPIDGAHQALAEALMIEGHADADNLLVVDDIEGWPIFEVGIVHEYKSMNDNQFKKLAAPKPNHKQQAVLYSAALNRPIVCYLYLNKNDSNLADFPVPFDPHLWNVLEGKARLFKTHYENNTEPPADVGFHCNDCGYSFGCVPYKAAQPRRTS